MKLPPTEWPAQEEDTSEIVAVSHLYAASKEKDSSVTETGVERMIKYYDDIFKLKRAVCLIVRVIKKILQPNQPIVRGRVKLEELEKAEHLIISTVQKAAFPEVIKQLTNYETSTEAMANKSAPYAEKGKLKKLHPVLISKLYFAR